MALKLPETLVLSITVHGVIDAQGVDVPSFSLQQGMRLTKISAVVPGVCNIMSPDDAESVNAIIKTALGSGTIKYKDVRAKLPAMIEQFKNLETEGVKELRDPKVYETDEQVQQYIRHTNKSYSVATYEPGQTVIDKMYSRSTEEGVDHPADFKITIMNIPEKYDLFSYILSGRLGATTTRASAKEEDLYGIQLSDLIEFVKNEGVKNVVIFDFSCSEMPDVTPRTKRVLRIRLAKEGLRGGKRTRRRNKKTKTRKAKKRRALWSH